jgi:hypothetical protein
MLRSRLETIPNSPLGDASEGGAAVVNAHFLVRSFRVIATFEPVVGTNTTPRISRLPA